jgi:hypothetical protein
MTRVTLVVVAVSLSLALVCVAAAQQLLSFHGRVLFVSGSTMGFAPDSGSSFEVDLTQVPQKLLRVPSQWRFDHGGGLRLARREQGDRSVHHAGSVASDHGELLRVLV